MEKIIDKVFSYTVLISTAIIFGRMIFTNYQIPLNIAVVLIIGTILLKTEHIISEIRLKSDATDKKTCDDSCTDCKCTKK